MGTTTVIPIQTPTPHIMNAGGDNARTVFAMPHVWLESFAMTALVVDVNAEQTRPPYSKVRIDQKCEDVIKKGLEFPTLNLFKRTSRRLEASYFGIDLIMPPKIPKPVMSQQMVLHIDEHVKSKATYLDDFGEEELLPCAGKTAPLARLYPRAGTGGLDVWLDRIMHEENRLKRNKRRP